MKQYYRLDENGEWIECDPSELQHGERYKMVINGTFTIISYWYDPDHVEP